MEARSIVDTHVHLWNVDRLPYPWLEEFPPLDRTHGPDEYGAAVGSVPVEKMVFVECTESFDDAVSRREVEWVSGLAERESRLSGIVAHASLEKGAPVRDHLDWLAERPLVTGVRRILQEEPVEFFLQPDIVDGVRALADYDFSFDLTVRASQLPAAIDLVDACPNVRFVLDHLGKPRIREGGFDPWAQHLTALAERPNVACKISGVLTEAALESWTIESVRPYVDEALAQFGAERVLFGGDWPVLRLAADYTTWIGVLDAVLEGASATEKTALFRTNAERVYELD